MWIANFIGTKILNSTMVSVLIGWQPGTWVLCYQLSRDGISGSTQHGLCDGKGATITLAQSKFGYVFGGYALKSFGGSVVWSADPNAFIFTLSNPSDISPRKFLPTMTSFALFDSPSQYYGWGLSDFIPVLKSQNSIPYGYVYRYYYDFSSVDDVPRTCESNNGEKTDIFLGTPDDFEGGCVGISMTEVETFYYSA